MRATALAHPNIALVKYWGNRDDELRLPANGSISFNLDSLHTQATVEFDPRLRQDLLTLEGKPAAGAAVGRVCEHLDRVRRLAGTSHRARVESHNNFPMGAGLASSASAFAALTLAACTAAGLKLGEGQLSRLARLGSGSASRSIPAGFVEWQVGSGEADCFARSIAPPTYWELVDCIAVVSQQTKEVGSSEGHRMAWTSPLQPGRVADAPRRLEACRAALMSRDFDSLAQITEQDCLLMHAVMMTSQPSLIYWTVATLQLIQGIRAWRAEGLEVAFTIDAGANVHCLCTARAAAAVTARLGESPGVSEVLVARPGGAARVVDEG